MYEKLRFSKFMVGVVFLAVSVLPPMASAASQEQVGTKCHFASYSIEERNTSGSIMDFTKSTYSAGSLAQLLKLMSTGAKLMPLKSGLADITIRYVVDYGPYKTLPEKNLTAADLLAALPTVPSNARTLTSPWLRLNLTVDCKLDVVFIFNMRQLIADQAFLAGVRPVVTGIVTYANDSDRYLPGEYEKSVIDLKEHPKGTSGIGFRDDEEISKRQEFVRRKIVKDYPPDLFWFFSRVHSNHSMEDAGTFRFQLRRNTIELIHHADVVQVGLVIALVKQFVTGKSKHLNYESILDVLSLVDLRKYPIGHISSGAN
jgi:hypothetical protein